MNLFKIAILAVIGFSVVSCSNDQQDNTNRYLKEMTGRYRLSEIYTDEAVDLNYDGVANTDLFIEMDCIEWPFVFYTAQVQHLSDDYIPLSYNVPITSRPEPYPSMQCFSPGSMFYNLNVNRNNGSISVVDGDLVDDETELERGKLEVVTYNNDTLRLEFNRRLMTRHGWQNFRFHMTFGKDPSLN